MKQEYTTKFPIKTPAPLPLSVPFTIRPNSLYGVHVKYWLIAEVFVLAATVLVSFMISNYAFFLLIPLIVTLGVMLFVAQSNKKNFLTITAESMTYTKNGVAQVIAMDDLAKVEWGLSMANSRPFFTLFVKNKTGDKAWRLSVLNFWNTRELWTVYASTPAQYQGAKDVQPFGVKDGQYFKN